MLGQTTHIGPFGATAVRRRRHRVAVLLPSTSRKARAGGRAWTTSFQTSDKKIDRTWTRGWERRRSRRSKESAANLHATSRISRDTARDRYSGLAVGDGRRDRGAPGSSRVPVDARLCGVSGRAVVPNRFRGRGKQPPRSSHSGRHGCFKRARCAFGQVQGPSCQVGFPVETFREATSACLLAPSPLVPADSNSAPPWQIHPISLPRLSSLSTQNRRTRFAGAANLAW